MESSGALKNKNEKENREIKKRRENPSDRNNSCTVIFKNVDVKRRDVIYYDFSPLETLQYLTITSLLTHQLVLVLSSTEHSGASNS